VNATLSAAVLYLAPPLAGVGAGLLLSLDLLAPLGLAVQLLALPYGLQLHLGYAILALWLARRIAGATSTLERSAVQLVALGGALNAVAILANGKMPYDPAFATRGDGLKGEPITAATNLAGLADTIPLAGRVISLGDIFLAAGIALLVAVMVSATRFRPEADSTPTAGARTIAT
jgi:Family of unknown function (DUF5317)